MLPHSMNDSSLVLACQSLEKVGKYAMNKMNWEDKFVVK